MFIVMFSTMETKQASNNGQMLDKEAVALYTMIFYAAMRKDEILQFAATQRKLEGIMLSKAHQKEEGIY